MPDVGTLILLLVVASLIGDWAMKRAQRRDAVVRLVASSHAPDLADPAVRYLTTLDEHLRLPEAVRREIELELRDHFEDSIAGLETEGLDRERATREAIARLGRPEELARQLRAAHQSGLRLLAGAAGGVSAAASGILVGYLAGFSLVVLALIPITALLRATVQPTFTIEFQERLAIGTIFAALVAYVPAFLAARRAVAATALISQRPPREVSIWWAAAGAGLITAALLFLVDSEQSWVAVAFEAGVPIVFVAGATLRPSYSIGRIRLPILAALVVSTIAGVYVMAAPAAIEVSKVGGPIRLDDPARRLDLIAPRVLEPGTIVVGVSGSLGGPAPELQYQFDTANLGAWHEVRVEAWRAVPLDAASTAGGAVDSRFHAPYLTIPIQPEASVTIQLQLGHSRTLDWLVAVTGANASGQRFLLDPLPTHVPTTFSGTVWDWLTASE